MIAIVWRFRPAAGQEAPFEAAYGLDGDWARLFRMAPGFVRVELLKAYDGDYLTIDYWREEADWAAFQSAQRDAYEALDKRCEALIAEEMKIGVFAVIGSFT